MNGQYLEPRQTRTGPIPPYEQKLAGAIEEIFSRGHHDLATLVSELNATKISAPDGHQWTEAAFVAQMQNLGA